MKYQEWQKELQNITEREKKASDEVKEKKAQFTNVNALYELAVVEGDPSKKLAEQVETAGKELQQAEIKRKAFEKVTKKDNKKLQQIGEAVIKENVEVLSESQKQIDASVERLQAIKESFYKEVKELGNIHREAVLKGTRTMNVNKALTGKLVAFGVSLNENDIIHVDNRRLDNLFKRV